ncbi:MAG: hypothetical protein RMJ89_02330 [Flammeovirgaceae bacterium]|nr:hypothetical protein [Flammeovirgaceae bacterium]
MIYSLLIFPATKVDRNLSSLQRRFCFFPLKTHQTDGIWLKKIGMTCARLI